MATLGSAMVAAANGSNALDTATGFIIQSAAGNWYVVFRHSIDGSVYWRKSTNKGISWGLANLVAASGQAAVWYDRWTPGDTGNLLHIAYVNNSNSDVEYKNLDFSSDTLSSASTIATLTSASLGNNSSLTITKTRGGNLACVYNIDGGTEEGAAKAASPFTSWSAIANPGEATTDWFFALPGNSADNQDFDLIWFDRSTSGLSLKTYDDSANSFPSEVTIIADGSLSGTTNAKPLFSGTIRHDDNAEFVCVWNAFDSATADLKCFEINAGTVTTRTDVVTNSDDAAMVALQTEQTGYRMWAYYGGKSDGSQVITDAIGIYGKYSDDRGVTWSAEQTLFADYVDDFRWLHAALSVASLGVAPPLIFVNIDLHEMICTAEIPTAGGGGGGGPVVGNSIVRAA